MTSLTAELLALVKAIQADVAELKNLSALRERLDARINAQAEPPDPPLRTTQSCMSKEDFSRAIVSALKNQFSMPISATTRPYLTFHSDPTTIRPPTDSIQITPSAAAPPISEPPTPTIIETAVASLIARVDALHKDVQALKTTGKQPNPSTHEPVTPVSTVCRDYDISQRHSHAEFLSWLAEPQQIKIMAMAFLHALGDGRGAVHCMRQAVSALAEQAGEKEP